MLEWLENNQLPCLYHSLFGVECPICGFQRSFILLLRGQIGESLNMYPMLIPSLIVILTLLSWLIFRKPGWKLVRGMLQIDLALIVIAYLVKLIVH